MKQTNKVNAKVNELVTIGLGTVTSPSGQVKLVKARKIQQRVFNVYPNDWIRVVSGDIWRVKRTTDGLVAVS